MNALLWLAFLIIGELLWIREDVARKRWNGDTSRGGLLRAVEMLIGGDAS